jgi:hypothetical protein
VAEGKGDGTGVALGTAAGTVGVSVDPDVAEGAITVGLGDETVVGIAVAGTVETEVATGVEAGIAQDARKTRLAIAISQVVDPADRLT